MGRGGIRGFIVPYAGNQPTERIVKIPITRATNFKLELLPWNPIAGNTRSGKTKRVERRHPPQMLLLRTQEFTLNHHSGVGLFQRLFQRWNIHRFEKVFIETHGLCFLTGVFQDICR